MRNHPVRSALRWLVPRIVAAVLATCWAVAPTEGAEIQLSRTSETLLEITGGSGAQAWRLRYGTLNLYNKLLVTTDGGSAWFSHGSWLRLIDTKKGAVIGRWRFPGQIVRLAPEGTKVQVEVEDRLSDDQVFRRTYISDPGVPAVPYWPNGQLGLYRVQIVEAQTAWPSVSFAPPLESGKVSAEQVRKAVPELEEAVHRDPTAPWLRIALGKMLLDAGDPRATEVFQEAVWVPTTDFTELFGISAYLDDLNQREAARTAFERGYQGFLEHGNDPRLFTVLIGGLILHARSFARNPETLPSEQRQELIGRIYKIMPHGEGAELAWRLYSDYLEKTRRADQARVWRARAEDARAASFVMGPAVYLDHAILIILASSLAAVLLFLVLYARYAPQRRLTVAAVSQPGGLPRGFALFNLEYWNRRQRVAFLTVVLIGWFTAGVAGGFVQGILRLAAMPIGMGMSTVAGPATAWYLENRLPATPERGLLRATAYQQDGETEKAERLYHGLPQFAESWNNLGVILKNAGKEQEARQAFEQALRVNPGLAEAALNLGRPPQSLWTELHQKYPPNRPMLAPPQRDRAYRAFYGGSLGKRCLQELAGPLVGVSFDLVGKLSGDFIEGIPMRFIPILVIGLLAFSLTVLLLIPSREVT